MDADLYVPGDGWLHRTDPRVKFLISIVMLALCLVWRNWAFILGILILEHVMLATDRVPAERIGCGRSSPCSSCSSWCFGRSSTRVERTCSGSGDGCVSRRRTCSWRR